MREETRQFLKVISLLSDDQMDELQDNLKALSGALQQVNLFLADLEKEQSEQTYNGEKIEDEKNKHMESDGQK